VLVAVSVASATRNGRDNSPKQRHKSLNMVMFKIIFWATEAVGKESTLSRESKEIEEEEREVRCLQYDNSTNKESSLIYRTIKWNH
jgi:hypothetical protein